MKKNKKDNYKPIYFPYATVSPEIQNRLITERNASIRQKRQFRHDWKIAIFGTFGGALAGLLTSIIFWLITSA